MKLPVFRFVDLKDIRQGHPHFHNFVKYIYYIRAKCYCCTIFGFKDIHKNVPSIGKSSRKKVEKDEKTQAIPLVII